MIRRLLTLMLIPVLFANQVAMCCAHTHHGWDTCDNSTRAHVHLHGVSHGWNPDGHFHGDSGNHETPKNLPAEDSGNHPVFGENLPVGHDSNALYFGDQDDFRNPPNRVVVDRSTSIFSDIDVEIPQIVATKSRVQGIRACSFTPFHGPIFLQTRCLLL